MRLSSWMWLVGALTGLGCLQVAQRNAIVLESYAVGERMDRVHQQETDLAQLSAQVTGLDSPAHLAQVAEERRLKLVAWSTLPHASSASAAAPTQLASDQTND